MVMRIALVNPLSQDAVLIGFLAGEKFLPRVAADRVSKHPGVDHASQVSQSFIGH